MTDVIEVVYNAVDVAGTAPQVVEVGYVAQTVQEGGGTPASTVAGETSYGQASAVGDDTEYARQDHTHGTPSLGTTGTTAAAGNHTHGRTLNAADTGFVETGNISVGTSFTQLGPDRTVPAAVGDVLELNPDMLCNNTGSDMQVEAATRTGAPAADNRYWSSGTATSRWTGGIGNWYVPSGFTGPRGPARLTVQAGDIVNGQVTVRLYGRVAAGSRTVFVSPTYPLRWTLTNLGAPA